MINNNLSLNLDLVEWQDFKLDEIFNIYSSKKIFHANTLEIKDSIEKYYYPYIVRTTKNNGIKGYIKQDTKYLNPTNTLTFAQDTFQIFYQSIPYYTGNRIKILELKNYELNDNIALFFITLLQHIFQKNSWGDSSTIDSLSNTLIKLPINEIGEIDYAFMETYIKELKQDYIKELNSYLEVTGLNSYKLTDDEQQAINNYDLVEWQDFKLDDLFEKVDIKKLNSKDSREFRTTKKTERNIIPAVVAKVGNNGIMYYVGEHDYEISNNKLVIISDGAVAAGIVYYHKYDFTILHNAYVIKLKKEEYEKEDIYLFFKTCIEKTIFKKYSYEVKPGWNKIKEEYIKLPVNETGEIDYDYMETYIKELKQVYIKKK